MQSAKQIFNSTAHVQHGEIRGRYLAAATGRQIQPASDAEAGHEGTRREARAPETPSRFSERLGYRRPSEADVMRQYAGRCYTDDRRAERDRCVGARATPMPNLGASLTGNSAAMCCAT